MEMKSDSFIFSNKKNENGFFMKKNKDINKKRQDNFDKNRRIENNETKDSEGKKPFDKKAYRLKKYSKKYKLEQWEEQRKKKMLRDYYKDVKNNPAAGSYKPIGFDEDTSDSSQVGRFVRHPDMIEKEESENKMQLIKKAPFHKAKERYDKVKQEKLLKQEEIQKKKEEKQQKIQEYKKKKQERFKKLSKKTKKGQPVMTGRLELLLEKIQQG